MKKNLIITAVALLVVVIYGFTLSTTTNPVFTGSFKYVGTTKCVMCHKTDAQGKQLDIWKNSKHASAWKSLETPAADEIAKQKGFTTKASETPQCIKCHVLGKDIDPAELTESFDKTEGVQCESCHGPGSEYKSMAIMKDKQKAIENGMNPMTDIAGFCQTCHNSESPTFKEFDFEKMWAQIKHKKP